MAEEGTGVKALQAMKVVEGLCIWDQVVIYFLRGICEGSPGLLHAPLQLHKNMQHHRQIPQVPATVGLTVT